ncbi:MAG: hypothetical protein KA165_07935 [Saprospiraceae bacterium]|nr:hypothetical protein [Saprospiraceae bacterium]
MTGSHRLTTAHELLQTGNIEKALQQMLPNTKAAELLAQFTSAQRELNFGKIDYKEFEKVQNRVLAAAMKLT